MIVPSKGETSNGPRTSCLLCQDEDDRCGQEHAHGDIEGPPGALRAQESLRGGAEGEPHEAARQGRQDEQDAEDQGLCEGAAGLGMEVGARRAGADQPGLRVDPLEGRGADEADGLSPGRRVAATRRRDLPGQPQKAAPIQLSARSTVGLARTRLSSPNATTNIITPMPMVTPRREGSPRSTPTLAPVAVSRTLLGPGVPAAATAKRRKATACSGVMMSDG